MLEAMCLNMVCCAAGEEYPLHMNSPHDQDTADAPDPHHEATVNCVIRDVKTGWAQEDNESNVGRGSNPITG
ncbi:hypothetical protein DPEC_G00256020 [Dallia pectoralis]|uniref:Uncharacterized protein n=1 Tax=Dallia pectoralis TaxID=75939 RepID=A0ACC2FUE7_DALPE|nr:hypothetical protein DPEC_G00256020 [Dallia pectoralis]